MFSLVIHYRLLVLLLIFIALLPAVSQANDKRDRLRQTLADIALLSSQVSQRKNDAMEIRKALAEYLETIEVEAHQLIRDNGIDSQAAALKHPRLFFDLMLIAEIRAYIDRYSQKIGYYRVAGDRLGYLYQQADDDLKIASTLSDLKIGALVTQSVKVLNDYLTDAQTLVIHPQLLSVDPPDKVWSSLYKAP